MALVRYDEPLAFTDGYGRTRQTIERRPGPNAQDWPQMTLNGRPIFQAGPEEARDLPLRTAPQNAFLLPQPTDDTLMPGSHQLRPLEWIWGQHFIYTADRTARSWDKDYELWTFPLKISSGDGAILRSIAVYVGKNLIYQRRETLRSLTLLLPQNAPGQPYELSINDNVPVAVNIGLKPVQPGAPRDIPLPVETRIAGLKVSSNVAPDFLFVKEWQADQAALRQPIPTAPTALAAAPAFLRHIGIDTPRSPVSILAAGLPSGMSGGFPFYQQGFPGTLGEYADLLSETGYDADYEQTEVDGLLDANAVRSYDHWAQLLAQKGIGTILVPDITFVRPFANNPNLAFEAAFLPDSHAPVYRDLQLESQRLARYGNFWGMSIGADNAGYVPYWDWAPPNPNRPWAEAYLQFQQGHPKQAPLGGDNFPTHDYERRGTAREFSDYLARFDQTWGQYGYFAGAVTSLGSGLIATTGSFGSSPGTGGRGGWPWASIPGEMLYRDMPIQTAYDWNEHTSTLPMHLEALLDRLRSDTPSKPTWAIVDDFKYHLTRQSRQRAYALALTRGVQAIGTTFLAHPTGLDARPQTVAEQRDLYAWIHKYGGPYSMTRTTATVGILFVQTQALMRPGVYDENPGDARLLHGSHEGKTTEALFLCHAAGWPARLITPAELRLGLPPEMRTVLLVGLNNFDSTWRWYDTLTPALKRFIGQGGKILRDDESACPVASTPTGMSVRAYVINRDQDWTPELFARNADNIAKLRRAMQGIPAPLAQSNDPEVWAIPTQSGATQYVTVVNYGVSAGKDAGQFVRPQIGKLLWHTNRPIYDVRLGRRINPAQAANCDLTQDAFRWYALPPEPVTRPSVVVVHGADGFYRARVTIGAAKPMTGIPVQITLHRADMQAVFYSATGLAAKLPLDDSDAAGTYTVSAKELLTGLSGSTTVMLNARAARPESGSVTVSRPDAVHRFSLRRAVPLTIALTPEQFDNPAVLALAERVAVLYRAQGRSVRIGRAGPNDVVLGLQPLKFPMHYPQWRTIDNDLILFGMPNNNILLLDQARALLFPDAVNTLAPGQAVLSDVSSPFVGERDVLDILAPDISGLTAAVQRLEALAR